MLEPQGQLEPLEQQPAWQAPDAAGDAADHQAVTPQGALARAAPRPAGRRPEKLPEEQPVAAEQGAVH